MSYLTRVNAVPIFAAVAACALAAGCTSAAPAAVAGTPVTSAASSPTTSAPSPTPGLGTPTSATATPTPTPTPTVATTAATGTAEARLAALAAKAPAAMSATYELMASGSTTAAHVTIDVLPAGYRVSVTRKGATAVLIVRRGADSVSCSSGKCFTVATNGDGVPSAFDPQVQHLITENLAIFATSPDELTVTAAPALGAATCFAVKPSGTGPTPVVAGHYCLDDAGHVVAATYPTGTLSLISVNRDPAASVLTPPSQPSPIVTTSPPQPID
ncbi:MAG: hypothetical protein QOG52_1379 [Frankiaceae bacterium]|nr:hypothetical protein [Frankiaceae bacterium]